MLDELLARLFGKKIVYRDSDYEITQYLWRGDIYVTKFEKYTQK